MMRFSSILTSSRIGGRRSVAASGTRDMFAWMENDLYFRSKRYWISDCENIIRSLFFEGWKSFKDSI